MEKSTRIPRSKSPIHPFTRLFPKTASPSVIHTQHVIKQKKFIETYYTHIYIIHAPLHHTHTHLVLRHIRAREVVAPDGGVDHEGHAEDGVHAAGVGHHGVGAAEEALVFVFLGGEVGGGVDV